MGERAVDARSRKLTAIPFHAQRNEVHMGQGALCLALRAVHRFAEVRIEAALAECVGLVAGPKGAAAKLEFRARHLIQRLQT